MIRLKVRTIGLILGVMAVLVLIGYATFPQILYNNKRYDALLAMFPHNDLVPEALYWSAQQAAPSDIAAAEDTIFIFHNGSNSSSNGESIEGTRYAISQLEKLVTNFDETTYTSRMNFDKAARMEMARWNLATKYMKVGEWEKAEQLFREIAEKGSDRWRVKESNQYIEVLASRKPEYALEKSLSLTGKVMIGDQPAAHVYVVLQGKDDHSWYYAPFGHYPMVMTDLEGNYRFVDIHPGDYKVGVGISAAELDGYYLTIAQDPTVTIQADQTAQYNVRFVPQLKVTAPVNNQKFEDSGKIRFEWEPYPGAAYYRIGITSMNQLPGGNGTSTSTMSLEDKWEQTSAEYSIDMLRTYPRGYGKSYEHDGGLWISPSGILGLVYPGGNFIWQVEAYDSDDRRISSSSGYYTSPSKDRIPFFSLGTATQLKGDQYVLQGNYEQAIEAYEQELNNPFALRALALMYSHGFSSDDRYHEAEKEKNIGDPAKALYYLQMIANPSQYDLQQMRDAYIRLGNQEEADRIKRMLEP